MLSCALRLRTKYQFGKGIVYTGQEQGTNRARLGTLFNLCWPRRNLKSQAGKSVRQSHPTPSLPMTAVSIPRYELLFVRTNQHFHVGPIIAALIGSGGNMQDCILGALPFQKGLFRAPYAACTGCSRRRGGKSVPCGRPCFTRIILCFLPGLNAFLFPTQTFSCKALLQSPKKTSSLFTCQLVTNNYSGC